jgi:hypothetical protein
MLHTPTHLLNLNCCPRTLAWYVCALQYYILHFCPDIETCYILTLGHTIYARSKSTPHTFNLTPFYALTPSLTRPKLRAGLYVSWKDFATSIPHSLPTLTMFAQMTGRCCICVCCWYACVCIYIYVCMYVCKHCWHGSLAIKVMCGVVISA